MKKHALPAAAVTVLALAAFTACGSPASGSTDSASASSPNASSGSDKGVLVVGGTGVSYPHSFMENDKLVGFDTEVIQEAAERAGYTVEFTTMDFPGLLGSVSSDKIDTTATNLTWTPERGAAYVFSAGYAFDGVGLATQKDNDEVNDLDDLKGKSIATGAGTTNEAAVRAWNEANNANIDLRTFETANAALQEVLIGRADATAGPRGSTIANIEKQGLELKPVGDLLTHEQTRFPFADTERGRQLAADISESIAEMQADGTLTELSIKYFTYDRTQITDDYTEPVPTEITTPDQYAAAGASSSAK